MSEPSDIELHADLVDRLKRIHQNHISLSARMRDLFFENNLLKLENMSLKCEISMLQDEVDDLTEDEKA